MAAALDGAPVTAPALPDGAVVVRVPPAPGPLTALAVAVPLAGLSPAAQRLAPLLAAVWSRDAAGPGRLCEPLVTADLVGIRVEALPGGATGASRFTHVPVPTVDAVEAARPGCVAALRAAGRSRELGTDLVQGALFGAAHRYGLTPADRARVVARCTVDELAAAADEARALAPVVAVAGPGEPGRMRARRGPPPGLPPPPPGRRAVTVGVPGRRAYHLTGAPGVRLGDPAKFALHVACAVLGGRDGLLGWCLGGRAYSFTVFSRELADAGYVASLVDCDPAGVDHTADAVDAAIAWLAAGAVTPAMLAAAVERLVVDHHRALRTARDRVTRACAYAAAGLDPAEATAYPERVTAVDAEQVTAAALRLADPSRRVEVTLLPRASTVDGQNGGKHSGFP
ncbi:MAG TPA: insulinase family protein [Mycobacteriales bacterium]